MAKKKVSKRPSPTFTTGYRAADITVLEGLEAVRRRPGMYIGTTGAAGLHHLVWEVFDNSRDEAMGGFADDVEVALLPGNRVRVADNGRGIPVDVHSKTKVSALETVMTKLHAGGKFGGEGYKVSGGLHGVGVSVVNALSISMRAEVYREGGKFVQEYKKGGKPLGKVKKVGSSDAHGTIITFEADPSIFSEREFNWDTIVSHMRQQAYLVRGLRISILDLRQAGKVDDENVYYLRELGLDAPSMTFYFEGGLRSLVAFQNRHVASVHKNVFYVEKEQDSVTVEIALQYVDDISSRISAFANNVYNTEGGMHVTGFKTALTRTLNSALKNGSPPARGAQAGGKEGESFTGDDVLEGLTAVISVKMREVQFEGQTKSKLGSVEARGAVDAVFSEAFSAFLEEHPDDARSILGKVALAMKARKAAKAAKDSILRKGALDSLALPGKLADCQTKKAEEAELFIVEGDSAGGCFHGDTKVALVDGRKLSFKELVAEHEQGKQNYCYTIDARGAVQVAPITHPRVTKKNMEVVQVTLDTGEEIICTPDHRFMLRDGSYKEAHALTSKDSLMPLRRKISEINGRITIKGYEMVWSPFENFWWFTHVLADRLNIAQGKYGCGEKTVIHHKDFNKRNNNPDNLERMDHLGHFFFHTTCLDKTIHSQKAKEKLRKIRQSREYREKIRAAMTLPSMRKMLSERAKKQWKDPAYKEYMTAKFLEFYRTNDAYRKKSNRLLNEEQRRYWSNFENRKKQSGRVERFFSEHPERREWLSRIAQEQWSSDDLRQWRAAETRKQWTKEFRAKRKQSYNQTYLNKALRVLSDVYRKTGVVDEDQYNTFRRKSGDRSIIRLDTIKERFFDNDDQRFLEAVQHYNHRVMRVKKIPQRVDVYDLEISGTHNFALASGVFVHNSGKMGRDRRTQAVLPLRGKILNIERARLDRMLGSEQIKNIVVALGTAIGDVFNVEKLRYHKLIIATDADVDGAHIRTLLLTLFYRHFRPVIDGGFLYIAQPPLYKIKKGKEVAYAFTDAERVKLIGKEVPIEDTASEEEPAEDEAAEEAPTKAKKAPKITVQRYKGLGEMNPEELWETTMDPARRILKQVTIEDAQEADNIFDMLMGTDVPARKSFIQSHAKEATLDI